MKILIISNAAWNNDNNFGNTFSNIFENINDIHIANIYCSGDFPKNNIVEKYYQITEKQLIKSAFNKKPAGKEIFIKNIVKNDEFLMENLITATKKLRWQIFFWLREIIWKLGEWKSDDLLKFVNDFKPDILYCPIYIHHHLCDIELYIKNNLNIPMVGHVTDDVYSLNQFRLSPFYWIDKYFIRKKIKKVVNRCEYLDTFTKIQKDEYEKIFGKKFNILYKSMDFSGDDNILEYKFNNPLKLVYTGNISSGRWENLILIGKSLDVINKGQEKVLLFVYTGTPITKKMKKLFDETKSIIFMGSVSSDKIKEIQDNADILIYTESFKLKYRLEVRMSFSTKIVDYFFRKKCVLVIGPADVASIDYFIKNDAGLVITDKKDIYDKIKTFINDKELLVKYAKKAWLCGKKNHQESVIKKQFYDNLKSVIKEYSENENITN